MGQSQTNRPNVVLIISDDHRAMSIGGMGDSIVQTPNLDALINGGVVFTNTFIMGSQTPAVCAPSRALLHTGRDLFAVSGYRPDDLGKTVLDPEWDTMGSLLRGAGYTTFGVGKWHSDTASFNKSFAGGAEIFFGGMADHWAVPVHDFDSQGSYGQPTVRQPRQFSSELFADAAVSFLKGYQGAAPFFLHVAFTAPHDPRTPPPPFDTMYAPSQIPLPKNFLPAHPFDNGELTIRDEELAPWPRTPEVIARHLADYYGMITHMDQQIGRIVAAVNETTGRDTVIIYMADHGLALGSHGLMGKQNLYQHSVKIPLIMRGANLPSGRRVDSLVYSYDVFRTVCDLAGISPPDHGSQSVLPLLQGAPGRQFVATAYKDVQRMVTDGEWKLIRYYRSPLTGTGTDRIQLFHLGNDPDEIEDLWGTARARPQTVDSLVRKLQAWQRSVHDPLVDRAIVNESVRR